MFEKLDLAILYFLNHDLANPVLDWFFLTISESRIFLAAVVLILAILLWKGSIRLRFVLILTVICVAIVDPTTHYILKNLVARLRPCHSFDDINLLVDCGGFYGFPSNHAANIFAAATILSVFYRRRIILFMTVAFIIGLSRIYLGRHYPSDVLAGAIFGIFAALIFLFIIRRISAKISSKGIWNNYINEIKGVSIWNKARSK